MFVRQLIGRNAGQIVEMPYHAGSSNITMGTCAAVTDAELSEAGIEIPAMNSESPPEAMPEGFIVKDAEGGGFDILDGDGEVLNQDHIPNLAAARSFAQAKFAERANESKSVKSALDPVPEGEPLNLTDEERATLPPLDPKASDEPENRILVEPKSKK
jgi:hypothetical protein